MPGPAGSGEGDNGGKKGWGQVMEHVERTPGQKQCVGGVLKVEGGR